MKKLFLISALLLFKTLSHSQTGFSISIQNSSGSTSITCATPSIYLTGTSSYTAAPVVYLWVTPGFSLINSASITITNPGTYTLTATAGTLNTFTTISIGVNTVAPVSALSPTFQNISCNPLSSQAVSLSAISPSLNVQHSVISPQSAGFSAISFTASYTPYSVGVYTYVLTNLVNGCSTLKTFTTTSNNGFPTFSLTSNPLNYTLGCSSKSTSVLFIQNAAATNSAQIPTGGPVSYSLLTPGSSSQIPFPSNNTITVPGNYTVVVKDVTTNCESRAAVSVIQNTTSPDLSVSFPTQILNCTVPSVTLQGSSTTPSVGYIWAYPLGNVSTSSIAVNSLPAFPTQSLVGFYTLTVTDLNSLCKTSSIVPMYQNLYPPKALIGNGGNSSITCISQTIMLTNQSSSTIPPFFPATAPVIGLVWSGPSPQPSLGISSSYVASTPGVYSLTAQDLNNGCISNTVITISDNRIYPFIQNAADPIIINCPNVTAQIIPLIPNATPPSNYTYTWTIPAGTSQSNLNSANIIVNAPGFYTLAVTHVSSGCVSNAQFVVVVCEGINTTTQNTLIRISPNPGDGLYTLHSEKPLSDAGIEVYDATGKLVYTQKLLENQNQVNLKELPQGLYILKLYINHVPAGTSKLIKE